MTSTSAPENPWNDLQARISALELAQYRADPATQSATLSGVLELLQACTESGTYAGLLTQDVTHAGVLCTRLAALHASLVMPVTLALDEPRLVAFAVARWVVKDLYRLSGFRGTLDQRILLTHRAASVSASGEASGGLPQDIELALLLSCLDDVLPEHVEALLANPGPRSAIIALSLLSDRSALTPAGEAVRERLLLAEGLYEHLPVYHSLRHLVSIVWMHCSYAATPRKHAVKAVLNGWFRQLAEANGLVATARRRPRAPGEKPVLMVICEMFRSGHAMFRWYAPIVRGLREHFTLHLLSLPEEVDADSIALFDRFLPVKDFAAMKAALKLYAPDMIYYPSVGMRAWAITLANIRWAPVQVMTLGHPATSHSPCMDAVLVPRAVFSEAEVFSETVLLQAQPGGDHIEPHRGLSDPVRAAPDWQAETFVVAIPCISLKLNGDFLAAVDAIVTGAGRPVRLEFFPNETGLALLASRQALQQRFPGAVVHGRASYMGYLQTLSRAHLALSPFPFGNSSSLVDVLLLGLPAVALRGREPHGLTDLSTLGAAGLADWCQPTIKAYVAAAIALIRDEPAYVRARALLCDGRFDAVHSGDDKPVVSEIVDTLRWAMRQGEALRAGGAVVDGRDGWS